MRCRLTTFLRHPTHLLGNVNRGNSRPNNSELSSIAGTMMFYGVLTAVPVPCLWAYSDEAQRCIHQTHWLRDLTQRRTPDCCRRSGGCERPEAPFGSHDNLRACVPRLEICVSGRSQHRLEGLKRYFLTRGREDVPGLFVGGVLLLKIGGEESMLETVRSVDPVSFVLCRYLINRKKIKN